MGRIPPFSILDESNYWGSIFLCTALTTQFGFLYCVSLSYIRDIEAKYDIDPSMVSRITITVEREFIIYNM